MVWVFLISVDIDRGNDWMNGNNPKWDTICDQGCAMSSLSMLLGGKGYQVNGTTSDPGKSSINFQI